MQQDQTTREANHLQGQTSPYLLQHLYNPVDWYPWGPEALQRAKDEDKPILVSIGYSACHWCHVMEHESFEDPEVAKLMNRWFVCIKIDREERPDIDQVYMAAVQRMTGQGGWPLNCFLTPELAPFFGGAVAVYVGGGGYVRGRRHLPGVCGGLSRREHFKHVIWREIVQPNRQHM